MTQVEDTLTTVDSGGSAAPLFTEPTGNSRSESSPIPVTEPQQNEQQQQQEVAAKPEDPGVPGDPKEEGKETQTLHVDDSVAEGPSQAGKFSENPPDLRERSSSQPLDHGSFVISPSNSVDSPLVQDSVETNLLASRLEALNIELFRDPRIAKFFEKRNDEIDWKWWGLLVSDYDGVMKKSYKTVVEKVRKGVPKQMRGLVWQTFTASKSLELEAQYQQYVEQDSPYEKVISRDVNRTFPQHEYFQKEAGQIALLSVVKAYSNYDHELGYCQGLGFVAGVLLMHMPPEEAFCVLVQLLAHYQLRFLFMEGMEGVHIRMYQLEALMKEHLPSLHQHFQQCEIRTTMFASSWFLTLFATEFPLDAIFRIYDIVLLEGSAVLFNFSLAILKRSQADLLKMNFEHSLEHLKERLYDKFSGPDDLVEEAFKFKITTKKLERLEKEAREYLDAKSNEEKLIQNLTQENIQLEEEVEMYRNLFTEMEQKNKQLEEESISAQEHCRKLQEDRKKLSKKLEDLKSSLTEEQYSMYTNLEQQLLMYKTECGKFVAHQAELERDLIETKLKYALAESERQRLLMRTPNRRVVLDPPRKIERVVTETQVGS